MKKKVYGLTIAFVLLFSAVAGAVEVPSATENTWETKEPVPQTQGGLRAVAVNGKIHVMGGSVHYVYDPLTDNWVAKEPMLTPRWYFGIAIYQNKIYTLGGITWPRETISIDVNEVYDPATDTWETREPMPTDRRENSAERAAAVGGKIHVLGEGVHDIYDIATDSWTVGEPKPYPLYPRFISLTVFDGKIFVLGRNATQIYDPKSDSWSLGTAAPIWVSSPGVGATSGANSFKRIYLFGGFNISEARADYTQVYDPLSDSWMVGEPMLTARSGPTVAVVDDIIYVIGGGIGWMHSCDVNEKYIPFGYGVPDPSYSEDNDKDDDEVVERASVVPIVVSVGFVVLVSLGLIVYFKRRGRGHSK